MFDFVQRVLLQRPSTSNVKDVYNHITATLGNVTTRVNLTTDHRAFRAAAQEVNNLNRGLKQSKSLADDFAAIVANATRRFAGISIATGTMLALVRGVKNAYKESLEFERQMKRVEIATGATESEVRRLSQSVLALGSAYGVSSLELANNARIFTQAGLNTRTTAKALEILAKTSVAGTFGDIGDTAEGVVASLQQFREEVIKTGGEVQFLERTFDSIQNVSKKYAVEAEDIVVGIRKAGAAFESAGGTIDELIGTMTTLRSTTRESASTLANSVKTIFTRIQRPETIDFLKEMGIELVDMEGKFVGPIEAINRLGSALAVLDKGDVRYAQIADKIGGIYQINRLLTLLKNTSMTSQAIDTSRDSSGVLSEDAQKGLETTISKIERLNQKFFDLIKTLGETSTIKGIVDLLIRLADSAIMVTKSLEPLMPMIATMMGVAGAKFAYGVGRRLMGIASNPTGMASTQVGGYSEGGRVWGGKPGTDTIPAMLDNGEFVVNSKDAAKHLGLLTAINNGRDIPGFAKGGKVTNWDDIKSKIDKEAYDNNWEATNRNIRNESLNNQWSNISGKVNDEFVGIKWDRDLDRANNVPVNPYMDPMTGASMTNVKAPTPQRSGKIQRSVPKSLSNVPFKGDLTGYPMPQVKDVGKPEEIMDAVEVEMQKSGKSFSDSFTRVMRSIQKQLERDLDVSKESRDVGEMFKATERSEKAITYAMTSKESVARERISRAVGESSLVSKPEEFSNARLKKIRMEMNAAQEAGDMEKVARGEALLNKHGRRDPGSYSTMSQATIKQFGLGPKQSVALSNDQGTGMKGVGTNTTTLPDSQSQQLSKSTGDFTQKALLAAGALAFLADTGGMTSDSFDKAAAAAATTYATVSVLGSAIGSFSGSFSGLGDNLKNFKKSIMGQVVANTAATISENAETAANTRSAASEAGKGGDLAGKFGTALSGAAIALAVVQGISSYFSAEAQAREAEKNEIVKKVQETGGDKNSLENILKLSKQSATLTQKSGGSLMGGISGAVGGAAVGAIVGSIVPVIGTAIGAAVGSVVGGIGGAISGSFVSTMDSNIAPFIDATTRLATAQYQAAKSTYDFDMALSNAKKSGLKGDDLIKVLDDQRKNLKKNLGESRMSAAKAEGQLIDQGLSTFYRTVGLLGENQLTDKNKAVVAGLNEANAQQEQNVIKASQEFITAQKDSITETINSVKSFDELSQVANKLAPNLNAIGDAARDAAAGSEEDKRKAQEAELKGTQLMVDKIIEAKGNEIAKTQAAIAMRQLEIDSIQRTASALTSFNKQSLDIAKSNQALQQFQTGSSDMLIDKILSDITNVSNRGEFNNAARAVGSTFVGGQEAARNVVIGSDFIDKFRSGITSGMGKNFEAITGSKLGAPKTQQAILSELSKIDSFRNLDSGQQKAIASTIQAELGDGFSADALDKALGKVTEIFKRDADQLAKQSDLINQNVAAIKSWNDALIESQMKTSELRAGQIDILGAGSNRMSQVMSRYGNVGTEMRALDSQEGFRTARANTLLEGSGVAPIAGNVQALSATLQDLQNRKLGVDARLKNTVDPVQRNNLTAENQKLAAATATVTNELTRLANQSDRASDIMAKIEKQRQIRDYQSGRAKDFITGGRQTRMKMFEETAAMQRVMQTGSFQNIPEELMGPVRQMMEERAKLDPTGGMQKALDRALTNDARRFGIDPRLVANQPDNAEKQLINELQALQVKEFQAQQALISAQDRNTQAMLQLINQMAMQMGQQINPAIIQQPQQFQNGQMQPNMRQRLNGVNNDFNQMQMNHQLNVNGQINLPGLNMDGIAQQLTQHIGNYVAQEVARQMDQRNRGFRTGG